MSHRIIGYEPDGNGVRCLCGEWFDSLHKGDLHVEALPSDPEPLDGAQTGPTTPPKPVHPTQQKEWRTDAERFSRPGDVGLYAARIIRLLDWVSSLSSKLEEVKRDVGTLRADNVSSRRALDTALASWRASQAENAALRAELDAVRAERDFALREDVRIEEIDPDGNGERYLCRSKNSGPRLRVPVTYPTRLDALRAGMRAAAPLSESETPQPSTPENPDVR